MAILKKSDLKNMSQQDRISKIDDLKLELIKANVMAHKSGAKTKEIKRSIARLMTYNKSAAQGRAEK
ncbi:50S ribosomal protein L29 [Candidatus Pacearchaeota archaeon]|nr:50S ribosomal protein L29 [Candidatus Pacearchaeota archaeon]